MPKPIAFATILVAGAALLGVLSPGCGGPAPAPAGAAGEKLRVVATTGIVADMARRVAGEHAAVEALMGPGVDPHLYKPSERDVRRIAEAQLILYNGLHLEGKMTEILQKMARTRRVVAVADAIPETERMRPAQFEGNPDPHVWFDVRLWSSVVSPIETALAEGDPANAAAYRENAARLRGELAELDAWAEARARELPEERRVLVTAHDAFGYFGRRYGFEVHGIQGISTVSEASLGDVERVVDLVVKRKVKALFVESSVPRRSIEAVQAACRARGHEVAIGGQLFSDSMGAPGTAEGTYFGMVRYNLDTIVEALR